MKMARKIKAETNPNSLSVAKKVGGSTPKRAKKSNGTYPLTTYEHAPIGIVECSPDGKHLRANEEFCRLLGYEKDELVGKGIKEITHEDDYPIDSKLHQQLVEGKIPFYRLEKRYLRKDGEPIWVELTRTIVRDGKGKPLYTIGVVLDISDRKQIERVLRDSSERLRLATEAARMFMWELDIQNRVYTFADNFEQVLGFSGGLLPKNSVETVERLSPEEDIRAFWDRFAEATENHHDLFSFQLRMINPENGETVWLETSAKLVYSEDGTAERMFGVAQNITQNKRAEELERGTAANLLAIAEANAKFRAFFDQGSYFAGVMALDGTLIEANRISLEFCGFKREDVVNKKFWDCGWWSPSPALREMIRKATAEAAGGKLFRAESSYYVADGSQRYVDLIIAPVKDESGKVLFLAPSGTDITERKQAEERLRQQAEILEGAYVLIRDLDSHIISWNKGVEQIYGWTKEEALGKVSHELFQTKFPVSFEDTQNKLFTNDEWEGELEHIKRDGTPLIVLSHQMIHRNPAGDPVAILENNIDITERKRIEQELARERELLGRLFETIPVLLTIYEPTSEVLRLNSQFERLVGWNTQDTVGISLMEACYPDPEYRKRVWEFMDTCAENEWMDIHMQTRDGRTLETSWSNIRLSDNMQVGIGIDITERKRTERAITEFARQQEALYQFTDQLQRISSLDDAFNAALDAILSGLQCDRASILLFDDQDVMSFVAWRGLSAGYRQATNGHSPWTPEAINPEPICMNDIKTADLSDSLRATIQAEGIGALAFIPLISNGKLIGKFMTYYNAPHDFDEDEVDLSLTIAHQLAFSVDRRRAEDALRASEEKYRRIVETANEGIWEIDSETRTTFVNGRMAEMLGYHVDEMLGRSSFEFVFPEDSDNGQHRLQLAREGGQEQSTEFRFRRKDGAILWALVSTSPQLDQQGNFLGSIAMIVDITERKQTEEKLRQAASFDETVMSNMGEGLYTVDGQGNVTFMNPAAEKLFGWTFAELQGHRMHDMTHFKHPDGTPFPAEECAGFQVLHHGQKLVGHEDVFIRKDGTFFDVIYSSSPLWENGKISGLVVVFSDNTARKQAEKRTVLLSEISELVRKLEDPGELLYAVSESVGEYLHAKRCLFNEIDTEHDIEIVHRDYCSGVESVAGVHKISDYSSITSKEMEAGKTVVNYDSKMDSRTAADYERSYLQNGERSYVTVPLMRENRWVASLWVSDDQPRRWSDEDVSLLETIAERTWLAVEKLRINKELYDSEERLRVTFNTAVVGFATLALDTRFIEVNDAFCGIVGYSRAELLKMDCSVLTHPSYLESTYKEVAQLIAGETPSFDLEKVYIRKDGQQIWVQNSISLVSDLNGQPLHLIVICQDISERKRTEEALQSSEQRFREIFETAGVSVWLEDFTQVKAALDKLRSQGVDDFRMYFLEHPDFVRDAIGMVTILDVNNETLDLFGASNKKTLLGSLSNVFAPETEQIFVGELMALAEGREMMRAETQVRTLDGKPISVLFTVHFAPPREAQNHVVVTLTDITERKRAEEALQVENERFMRFVDSNIVGILIGDVDGRVVLANDYYLKLLGVSRPDFNAGKVDWKKFTPPEWLPADEKAIRELREAGVCEPYEKEYIRSDGTRVPVYIANAMLPGPGEEIAAFVLDLTERKRSEVALRESEALYRTIARSIPGGGVYVVDKDMRYIVADGAVTKAFGLSREMLEGHTISEVFQGEQRARMEERLMKNFVGETVSYETENNGRVYWTQQAPLTESVGQAIIVTLDITERKQAEEALRQSEELFMQFMEHLPGLAWIKDTQGRYVYANAASEEAFNISREKLYGKTDREIFPTAVAAQFEQNDRQALLDKKGIQVVETLEHADRVLHYSLVSKFPIPGPDGKATLVGGTAFDITERKQAEEALQESEERYRSLFDFVPIAVYTCDAEGLIQEYNQRAVELWGREPAINDPNDRYCASFQLYYPDGRLMQRDASPMARILHGEILEPQELEIVLERPDGTRKNVIAHPLAIRNEHGEIVEAINCLYDITERKQAEDALQKLNLELETHVIMRTAQLQEANTALQESRKRLQVLSQRLVEVQEEERRAIARELHDRVGQTLSALNINLIIIRDQLSPDSTERIGPRLSDSMQLVGETITLVRDVMSNLRPAVLDDYGLEAALQSHVNEFQSRYGIPVVLDKQAQPLPRLGPSIEMTFLRIAQEALINIARHAQAKRVTLSLRKEADTVYMTIQDNGTGIVSWQQANRPGSHGLTIMRERAEAVGGNLWVTSIPGTGTTVEISIPVSNQDEAQKEINE